MADAGRIVTFYSYKGGTGRSMALANFAWILASNGHRVITIDWDLEAPGLHRYFRPFLIDPDLYETDGLIDMFWELTASAMAPTRDESSKTYNDDGGTVAEALQDATRSLDWKFGASGCIDFIGAGRQSDTYSERVNSFDWKRFYDLGGVGILDSAKAYLRKQYEWVLIDSRTGVSDTSGVCTIQMPEAVVACFTLNRQSIDGVTAILRSVRRFRSDSVDGSKIRFFPIAMRIENNEKTRLEIARRYVRTTLEEFLPFPSSEGAREYWDKMEIGYIPAYAFEEVLAIFGDPSGAGGAKDTMLAQFEGMAQKIAGTDNLKAPEIVEADRAWVLKKYALAESQSTATEPPRDVTSDTAFLRAIHAKEAEWRSLGNAWRLLLSRRELDLLTPDDRKAFGRNMSYYLTQSERMRELRDSANSSWGLALAISVAAGVAVGLTVFFGPITITHIPAIAWVYGYGAFGACWVLLSFFRALSVRNRPYGSTVLDALLLYFMGPLASEIKDYTMHRTITGPPV